MTKIAGSTLFCFVSLVSAMAHGQTVPLVGGSPLYTGFQLPKINGTLQYSLSASERVTLGYNDSNETANSLSLAGNLAFLSPSVVYPFNINYSGGYLANTSGQSSSYFQSMALSQGLNTKYWHFGVSDSLSYLPETASSGLSGIPGVGDIGVSTGTITQQGVLTPYSTRITNSTTGSATRQITGSTSFGANGSVELQRFLGSSQGISTNSYSGGGSVSHRIDALTNFSVNYSYSQFSYTGNSASFGSQGLTVSLQRQVNRKVNFSVGGGPERIGGSTLTGAPAQTTYSAQAGLNYVGSVEHGAVFGLSYSRATNSGSGVNFGAESQTVSANASRGLTRSLHASASISYAHSTGLQLLTNTPIDTESVVAGVQANRAITRTISAFVSYNAQRQTYTGSTQALSPLQGVSQTLGFGVTYSPTSMRIGRQ